MSSIEYINSAALTAATGSVTFSGIPQNYQDLIISGICASQVAGPSLRIRFNADSGSNYSATWLGGNGSATTSSRESNVTSGYAGLTIGGSSTTLESVFEINILSYSNISIFKTVIESSGTPSTGTGSSVSLWRSASAVSSISLSLGSSFPTQNLSSGSTFTLWGVR